LQSLPPWMCLLSTLGQFELLHTCFLSQIFLTFHLRFCRKPSLCNESPMQKSLRKVDCYFSLPIIWLHLPLPSVHFPCQVYCQKRRMERSKDFSALLCLKNSISTRPDYKTKQHSWYHTLKYTRRLPYRTPGRVIGSVPIQLCPKPAFKLP